jgi:signal peptidase I
VTDLPSTPATEPSPPPPRRRALGCLIEVVETIALTAVIFVVLQTFVAQPFKVEQVSMRDTIEEGQYVLVDKLTPRFDSYHRGDIIVFSPPDNAEIQAGKPYIKRIIGVAGDQIAIRGGDVFVNGVALDEPYLFAVDGTPQPTTAHGGESTWTVPNGKLFVMGDHRERSADSRDFGPIEVESVIGRAWLRYWPLPALGILPTDRHPELGRASPTPSSPGSAATQRPLSPSGASATP